MKKSMEIMRELEALGVDIPELPSSPFEIPNDYFEKFSQGILDQVHTETFLETLPKSNPYQLEAGYFDQLPATMVGLNYLDSLSKVNVYSIPENYFGTLPDQILRKAKQEKRIQPMRKASPVFGSLSIAASILLILGIGFLLMRGKVETNVEERLALVSKMDIEQYLNNHELEFADDLTYHNVDESEVDMNSLENDVYNNLHLDGISSEEIDQYTF